MRLNSADDMKKLASVVKSTRRAMNLPMEEVARRAGLQVVYYAYVENARVAPSPGVLARIAAALGVSLDTLCRQIIDGEPVGPRDEPPHLTVV
jgi:transcriptional regulator with XRE-family HTH domain